MNHKQCGFSLFVDNGCGTPDKAIVAHSWWTEQLLFVLNFFWNGRSYKIHNPHI